jgi:hypothetical protein
MAQNHPAVAAIKAAMKAAAEKQWKEKAGEVFMALKAGDKLALRDGDTKPQYEGYKGNRFINASNKIKPLVIDGNLSPLQASSGKPYATNDRPSIGTSVVSTAYVPGGCSPSTAGSAKG